MSRQCTVSGCSREFIALDFCSIHYERARRGRDLTAPVRIVGDDEARFWQKVQKQSGSGCWEWVGGRNRAGYGRFSIARTPKLAHRISYEWSHGQSIPPGMSIDHVCHNTSCVNPAHLRLATHALNNQNAAGARRGSLSGIRGVRWHTKTKKWQARASLNGKGYSIGYFDDIKEAELAAIAWRRKHMPYSEMDQRKDVSP